MKKITALLLVCTILAWCLPPAFAGGSGWHHSQTRRNAAYKKWLKQEADFWKRFDAEMAEAGKENESDGPVKKRKQR